MNYVAYRELNVIIFHTEFNIIPITSVSHPIYFEVIVDNRTFLQDINFIYYNWPFTPENNTKATI